jgi:hypothetical protein
MVCGESAVTVRIGLSPQETGGCGRPIAADEAYRCVDCSIPFHRTCLLRHFVVTVNHFLVNDRSAYGFLAGGQRNGP